jgi:hypothetical protein
VAEAVIRLVIDPVTGKKDVLVKYVSDEDALPMEHEEEHRRLVERLLAGGVVSASELGMVVVEREGSVVVAEEESASESVPERRAIAREE